MEAEAGTGTEAEAGTGTQPATLGRVLASARKARGLTLGEVATKLRLERRFVAALEEERWELFVAPVFVKGHLRQLAELYGLKYEGLLAVYVREANALDVQPEPVPRVGRRRRVRWGLVIGGLILLAAIASYFFTRMGDTSIIAFPDWWWELLSLVVEPDGSDAMEFAAGSETNGRVDRRCRSCSRYCRWTRAGCPPPTNARPRGNSSRGSPDPRWSPTHGHRPCCVAAWGSGRLSAEPQSAGRSRAAHAPAAHQWQVGERGRRRRNRPPRPTAPRAQNAGHVPRRGPARRPESRAAAPDPTRPTCRLTRCRQAPRR